MYLALEPYRQDSRPPFTTRVFLDDYSSLDPMRVPWREVRRHPDRFPDWHIAKVSSVRTVIGLDFAIHTGETRRIYLKRSLQRDKVKQLLARFRATKEWREFQLAQEFAEAGVTVPQPVYYAEGTDENGQPSVYYATIGFGDYVGLKDADDFPNIVRWRTAFSQRPSASA